MGSINVGGQIMDLGSPKIMGILNLTADSFFDGGQYLDLDQALVRAELMLSQGADIIDLGAYSTRPGADEVSAEKEIQRLIPVIEAILKRFPDTVLSVDTFRAQVAREAIQAGAHLINDVSGGELDADMFQTVASLGVPYILMHMRGTPQNMQSLTDYEDLLWEITHYFSQKIQQLRALGVKDIILDPGFGFAKTLDQNYELLNRLDELHVLRLPILGAVSRKSMIYKALDITPQQALNGSTVLHTLLLSKGVQLLRVHDVPEAKQALELFTRMAQSAALADNASRADISRR